MLQIVNQRELSFPQIHFILKSPRHPEFFACRLALQKMISKHLKEVFPAVKEWEILEVDFDSPTYADDFGKRNILSSLRGTRADRSFIEVTHIFGQNNPTAFGAVLTKDDADTDVAVKPEEVREVCPPQKSTN